MDDSHTYVERVLKVLLYIEEHIEDEISMEDLAKLAHLSPFYFHRIFHVTIGETAHKYIRRIRLEKAAMRLRYGEEPITDIALDSSYDTPSAFTRAFKQSTGKSPKDYRMLHKEVTAMTKKITELTPITPEKIEKIADLPLLFIRRVGNYQESAFQAWVSLDAFLQEHSISKLDVRCFGIAHDDPRVTSEENLRYDAAVLAPSDISPKGEVGRQTIKGGKYAIFIHNGSYDGLDDTFNRIFLKWLPSSKEAMDESRPVFEEYFHLEFVRTDPNKLVTKIYIPLL